MFCPEGCIKLDPKSTIDYDYCKGFGICMHECPVKGKAIKMVPEREAKKDEKVCKNQT